MDGSYTSSPIIPRLFHQQAAALHAGLSSNHSFHFIFHFIIFYLNILNIFLGEMISRNIL